ncbi:MAG TPA: hypothetical protein VGR35_00705 [Tepidisphaeraceae bacterium]|nr:hypothetical protein [Tepidisphaeraceae bacterium]
MISWFMAYCILMALLYGVLAVMGIVILLIPTASQSPDQMVAMIQGVVLIVMGVALAGLFGVAPFLPRRPWVWIYDLVLICLGLTSVCCLPATIPLLILWIKPEAKAWFGRV